MTTRKPPAAGDGPRQSESQEATTISWQLKALLSALLAFHVTAVFWAPLMFASSGPQGTSPFAEAGMAVLRPYIGAMFLDHGYAFFAPDPGPSHLVRYQIEFADGRQPIVGRFPDLKTEQPRLLYHRHFMMAEALNNLYTPPQMPPEPSPPPLTATKAEQARYRAQRAAYRDDQQRFAYARRRYETMQTALAEHLKHRYGGSKVTLTRVEHRLGEPGEVRDGVRRLDDPDSYTDLPEVPPRGASR
ncbi:MAG: hypothetical protein SFU86_19740 [Pirellulaceae bacterium]|nr:hypothetical protein [Pirellulaceae bacterium]